jgi:trans-aconitate methyltransferase
VPCGRRTAGTLVAMDPEPALRFYTDMAPWWPLISAPEEYAEEAAEAARHLRAARIPVREVLELGSGGGNNAVHLKAWFDLTLVDLNPEMVAVSASLNPECSHAVGDMRSVRLGRTFDAVFIHDAVSYMLTEADLLACFVTAFEHCRPGGIVVVIPDDTAESWQPGTDHGGHDGADGRGARYLEWEWDPDPTDTWTAVEYAFLLRAAGGDVEVVHETHRTGLFPTATWLRLLERVGFTADPTEEHTTEDRPPRTIFLGHRPFPPTLR